MSLVRTFVFPIMLLLSIPGLAACGTENGGGGSPAETVCQEELLQTMTRHTAAECTTFCEKVVDCSVNPKAQAFKAECAKNCSDDVATALGPFIESCGEKSCGEMRTCLSTTKTNYGQIAGCAVIFGAELLLSLFGEVAIEMIDFVICLATLFLLC